MWIHPGAGALALITLIAAFAVVTGTTLLVTGFRMRRSTEAVAEVAGRIGKAEAA
jgi:uncharacterized membrane protein HdeD (DUF308 family)